MEGGGDSRDPTRVDKVKIQGRMAMTGIGLGEKTWTKKERRSGRESSVVQNDTGLWRSPEKWRQSKIA